MKFKQQILSILLIMLMSCTNNEIKLLYDKKIVLLHKDTIYEDMKSLKLVSYIDSTNCSSCNINNLYSWIPYIKLLKESVDFYLIITPKKNEQNEIKTLIRKNNLREYLILDEECKFEKLNPHLPKNKAMHTFLLDENNKVILVGNPLYNKEIEKLFYKITQELLSK